MRAIKTNLPVRQAGMRNTAILFFSLFLTLAVFSQISAANPKPTYDVGLNKADWLYYKSNNDITAYLGKKDTKLPTVRYQKDGDYLEFSMTGVSSTTSVALETNTKTPNTPTLFYRNILDGVDANYQITNVPFKIKEEIVLKKVLGVSELGFRDGNNNLTPITYNLKPITFLFSAETTGKPSKQNDGSIAFFGENGEYLFQLDKPFMVDTKGNRSEDVSIEIISTNKKPIVSNGFFDALAGASAGIVNRASSLADRNVLSSYGVDNQKVLEARGIEPPRRGLTIPTLRQAAPRTGLVYHKPKPNPHNLTPANYQIILSADSNWLSTASYPVIIDPTVTHNADANFTGQMNRIADSDTTSSTQLEASYPEATKDPYTVLLLHFNEANGATAGIRDYASTTRVITANGNASTTSYVTQLGLGNSAAFDGAGDYFSAPDDASLDFAATDNFTIDFWIKHNTIATNPDYAVTKADTTTGGYKIYMDASGDMCFDIDDDATWTPDDTACTSGIDYDDNVWHHIAGIKTGATKIELFVDGVLAASDSALAASGTLANTNGFYVGMDRDGLSNGWDGQIDEVRVISRALTPEEIKAAASRRPYAVYTSSVLDASASVQWDTVNWTEGGVNTGNGEQPYNTNSLVAQWDFNDTSGTTLTASSSGSCTTSCNGTLTNFAYTASQDQATTTTGWTANNKKWGAGSLMFDGTNDYVSVSDNDGWTMGTGDFTMEAWINRASLADDIVIAQGEASDRGFNFWVQATGVQFGYSVTAAATTYANFSYSFATGIWYHVVVVRSGSDLKAYINGSQVGSAYNIGSDNLRNSGGNLQIGAIYATPEYLFNGIIDSTHIYKGRALSQAEILSNYNAGNIEIQTRTGATSDPNDGSWGEWKPTTGETQLLSMDSDAANWRSDIVASTTIATSTDTTLKMEGTGSLKIEMGKASTTAGTVALWHFEETGTTTGTYLYDETANNNDATTTGTTVVDGIFGKARKFNGTSDRVSNNPPTNLPSGANARTIEAWAKVDSFGGGNTYIYSYGHNNCSGSDTFALGVTSAGKAYFAGCVNDITGNATLSTNQWYHLAATYDGTTVKMYINGVLDNSAAKTLNTTVISSYVGVFTGGTSYFNGTIDEVKISNRVLSPDEIAETYRMGANHHLTRQVSATDLSAQTKLAFWIAADRPGTGLETMLGESDYANYELASSTLALSTTTVLYIKGDEIASSTSIKDSSFSGKAITANGNARTAGGGKIGNAVYFDGTGDYFSAPDSDDWYFGSGDFSIEMWVNFSSVTGSRRLVSQYIASSYAFSVEYTNGTITFHYSINGSTTHSSKSFAWSPSASTFYHIAFVRNGSEMRFYVNGTQTGATASMGTDIIFNSTANLTIGENNNAEFFFGYLDEFRILKGTALTADQIRQAYEYGLRTHPVTIDFGATLQTSDLISSATDYNFSLTATTSGLSATTSGLYLGDKIIIKENLGGTEYTAQGTVNAINTATGAITVPSWDTGSTFPASNGYSPNATVFKWQREYFDLGGAATTTRDAITNLTLRPTNGAEGRTIYLDDFRYNTNYLTASSSSAITSGNNRYLQYRAILTSTDTFVSPFLTAFNTLYTSLANSFPAIIGVSGGGFLSF